MKKGYTLIEVMIVIVIIGIIASVIGLAYVGIHFISKFWQYPIYSLNVYVSCHTCRRIKMAKTIRMRLILEVDFIPNGESNLALKTQMKEIVTYAFNRGLITGETNADIEGWQANVEHLYHDNE